MLNVTVSPSSAELLCGLAACWYSGAAALGLSLQEAVEPLLGIQSSLSWLADEDQLLSVRPFFLMGEVISVAADLSDVLGLLRVALSAAAALSGFSVGALVWRVATGCSALGLELVLGIADVLHASVNAGAECAKRSVV